MTASKSAYLARESAAALAGAQHVTTASVVNRYGISPSTLARWRSEPRVGFPVPLRVCPGSPLLFDVADLDEFDKRKSEEEQQRRLSGEPARPTQNVPPKRRKKWGRPTK